MKSRDLSYEKLVPVERELAEPKQLMAALKDVEVKLREQKLEPDADLIKKAMDRLERYRTTVRTKVEAHRQLPIAKVSQLDGEGFPLQLTLADRINETGGRRHGDNGSAGTWYRDAAEAEAYPVGPDEGELVNEFPSQQGMVELMRGLGVIQAGEGLGEANTAIVRAITTQAREASTTTRIFNKPEDHLKFPYAVALPTNMRGVGLQLERKQFSLGGDNNKQHTEQVAALKFTPESLEAFVQS